MVDAGDVLAGPDEGAAVVTWMLERARTGLCALQLGVTEEAVRRAAAYLNQRHQFGRPLSSFQGTMLRAADAYIDSEAIRVTTWQAAWRLDTGRPAAEAVAVAHWWASEAGQRVVHATQHLHGGLGADIAYPIHRYFLWGKQIELMLQGPSAELARLGAMRAGGAARRRRPGGDAVSPARADTLAFESLSVGDALPELVLPLSRTFIVATAIASRDYQDVHHDPGLAVERGSRRHLHEHPHHQRAGGPVRHRLVRPGGAHRVGVDPPGRAQLPRRHHDPHRVGGRRRGRRGRAGDGGRGGARRQQPRRPRHRHGAHLVAPPRRGRVVRRR